MRLKELRGKLKEQWGMVSSEAGHLSPAVGPHNPD